MSQARSNTQHLRKLMLQYYYYERILYKTEMPSTLSISNFIVTLKCSSAEPSAS